MSTIVRVDTNARALGSAINQWAVLSGKGIEEAVNKQGKKFAHLLTIALKQIAPPKGGLRAYFLAKLAAGNGRKGEGLFIRDSVKKTTALRYGAASMIDGREAFGTGRRKVASRLDRKTGKRFNYRNLLVKRELNLRERSRFFLASSAGYKWLPKTGSAAALSKHGKEVARAFAAPGSVRFSWSNFGRAAEKAAAGMTRPKALRAVEAALKATTADIMLYVNRKINEAAQRAMGKT